MVLLFFSTCLEKDEKDGKFESVYVNWQFIVFPCCRKRTETWSTGIPVSLPCLLLPPTQNPTVMGGGGAWQWTAVCVCVCVRLMSISCFIEEAAFACTDRSDFHCEKKKAEKKSLSTLMNQYGKQLALCLGRTIPSVTHLAPFSNANTTS